MRLFSPGKALLWVLLAVPAVLILHRYATTPGFWPGDLLHPSGEWSARAIIVALMLTPLAQLFPGVPAIRWLVRHRMAGVRDALAVEGSRGGDAWLAAREQTLHRERSALLRRLAALGPRVLDAPDVEGVRAELLRLVGDLERHRQHLNDLVYDSVTLELGGSE